MSTTRTARTAAALSLALGAALLVTPATASTPGAVGAQASPLCAAGSPGTAGRQGDAQYDVTSVVTTTTGKKKKATSTTAYSGNVLADWVMQAPSCLGVSYVLTVASPTGTSLGWSATSSSGRADAAGLPATSTGATVVSLDGSTARTVFTGDGVAQAFAVAGSVSGSEDQCVFVRVTVEDADGTVLGASAQATVCADVPGATNMY